MSAPGGSGGGPSAGDGQGAAHGPPFASRERVRRALERVIDPEVGLDVVRMGLIYGIEVDGERVKVRHTLTTRGCPLEAVIRRGIEEAIGSLPGVERVETEVVWDPPWQPGMIHFDASRATGRDLAVTRPTRERRRP